MLDGHQNANVTKVLECLRLLAARPPLSRGGVPPRLFLPESCWTLKLSKRFPWPLSRGLTQPRGWTCSVCFCVGRNGLVSSKGKPWHSRTCPAHLLVKSLIHRAWPVSWAECSGLLLKAWNLHILVISLCLAVFCFPLINTYVSSWPKSSFRLNPNEFSGQPDNYIYICIWYYIYTQPLDLQGIPYIF